MTAEITINDSYNNGRSLFDLPAVDFALLLAHEVSHRQEFRFLGLGGVAAGWIAYVDDWDQTRRFTGEAERWLVDTTELRHRPKKIL